MSAAEGSTDRPEGQSAAEIREDIDRTRGELADTVDGLAQKMDVKSQAADRLAAAKQRAQVALHRARQSAPEPVGRAADATAAKLGPPARSAAAAVRPHRAKIAAGAGLAAVVALVVRRRHRRKDRS